VVEEEPETPEETPEEKPEQPETPEKPEEQPEKPEQPEETPEDGDNQSVIQLDNGFYTIDASYLKADNNKPSAMGSYMDESVFVFFDGNKVEVTITVNDDETVTKLQVNGK